MPLRIVCFSVFCLSISQLAFSAVVSHLTVERDRGGNPVSYVVTRADDNGNLAIENYDASTISNPDNATFDRARASDAMVFQATEKNMLSFDGGQCRAMNIEEGPAGMQDFDTGQYQEEMKKAQAAIAEMAKQNPEMAKMLQSRMGGAGGPMMGQKLDVKITESGETRTIDGYDTTRFDVSGMPGADGQSVWAADVDDVEGGRTISNATLGMMNSYKQTMEQMGADAFMESGMMGAMMEKMEDYYPILMEDGDGTSVLVSTDVSGTADFYPECR